MTDLHVFVPVICLPADFHNSPLSNGSRLTGEIMCASVHRSRRATIATTAATYLLADVKKRARLNDRTHKSYFPYALIFQY